MDCFQQHGAFVLVEPFSSGVDVVVGAGVWATDNHDGDGVVVDAVVVYRGFEEVGIFGEPFGQIERARKGFPPMGCGERCESYCGGSGGEEGGLEQGREDSFARECSKEPHS